MQDGLIEATVARTWQLATGYRAVELRANEDTTFPPFDKGAFVDVVLDPHTKRSRRQPLHWLSSGRDSYVFGVRSGSSARLDSAAFNPGSALLIRSPQQPNIALDADARHILFAGGLGVATIAGIARRLADAGHAFSLHHFAQSPDRAVFQDELDTLEAFGRVHHRIGLAGDEIVQAVSHALSPTHANTHVYCSGPPKLMDLIERHAKNWVYPGNLHKIFLGEVLSA